MQKSTSIFRGDRTFSRMVLSVLEYRSIVLDGLGIAVGFSHGFCVIGAWWSKIYWLNAVAVWVFFTQVTHMFGLLHCCCLASQSYTQPPEKGILSQRSQDTGRLDYLQNPMDQMAIICHIIIYAIECWYYMPLKSIKYIPLECSMESLQWAEWWLICHWAIVGIIPKGTAKNWIGKKHRRCIHHQFSYSFLIKKKHIEHEVIFPMNHNKLGVHPPISAHQAQCPRLFPLFDERCCAPRGGGWSTAGAPDLHSWWIFHSYVSEKGRVACIKWPPKKGFKTSVNKCFINLF